MVGNYVKTLFEHSFLLCFGENAKPCFYYL